MQHLLKLGKRKVKLATNALTDDRAAAVAGVPDNPIVLGIDLGCTVIYEGEKPILADLVFVHGLGGHPVKSWSKKNVYWPRDLLGPDVPNVRILTFGYTAKAATMVEAVSQNNIHDHAKALVSDLRRQRKQEEETIRPIIFMAHSLGGIVVKDALEYSKQNVEFKPQLASIYLATYAVIFFGTPHRGSQTASLGVIAATTCKAVGKECNANLLRSLETSSETLERISEAFAKTVSRREIKVHSFLEEFSMSPLVGKIVEDFSGRIGDAYEGEDRIPADHREMIKFINVHEIGYKRVLDVVEGFVAAAAEAAKTKRLPQQLTVDATVHEPVFMVPFFQNDDFIGRESMFQQLEGLLRPTSDRQLRAALWGLGGIGKTSIAVEFCYRRKKAHPLTHIFWIHGNSDQTFRASYFELSKQAGLTGALDNEESRLNEVKKWLEISDSRDWMMVIDNLDDIDLIAKNYIPVKRGTILYTTRDKRLIGHPSYLSTKAGVEVPAMSEREASETLSQLLGVGSPDVKTDAYTQASRELLLLLENLPLAIAQAAAYIRESHIQLHQYVEVFKECEKNQQEFLSKALPNAIENEGNQPRAVMTTWKITFDKIQLESPISIGLLELMSYLGPEEIPQSLIKGASFFKNENSVFFMKILAPLLNYTLLYQLEASNYRLHRLVAFWVRAQIDRKVQQANQQCLESAVILMSCAFPYDPLNDWQSCTLLLPHALAVVQYARRQGLDFESLWQLQDLMGRYLERKGNNEIALEWFQRALDGKERVLGKDHLSTLDTIHNMAGVFRRQRQYSKALQWYQRALDGKEKTLGKYSHSTLATVHGMADLFDKQREHNKALEWYQRALDGCEKTLGKDHLDTLRAVNSIAIMFRQQGEHGKALEWFQRALDGREKTLGKDHPDTLRTVDNMAFMFTQQGEHGKALEWFQRTLDGWEKTLGKDHPDTLQTVNNIAIMFTQQGEHGKALEWFQRALDGWEKILGKDHPDTLRTVNSMAIIFRQQGEHGKALEWFQRALDGREKILGKDHPDTLEAVKNMAFTFKKQGRTIRIWTGASRHSKATKRRSGRTALPLSAPSK